MKRKNITKLPLCRYCVRKNVSKYHFSLKNILYPFSFFTIVSYFLLTILRHVWIF
jgi:hypothetical protein